MAMAFFYWNLLLHIKMCQLLLGNMKDAEKLKEILKKAGIKYPQNDVDED